MRYVAMALVAVGLMAAPAAAQCTGGVCQRPIARAVAAAPMRVAIAPVQVVGRLVCGVRARRAVRINRRVARRVSRRGRRGH